MFMGLLKPLNCSIPKLTHVLHVLTVKLLYCTFFWNKPVSVFLISRHDEEDTITVCAVSF